MMKVIRLMGSCDNRCSFCMVHSELEENADRHIPLNELIDDIRASPPGTSFDLFGGEPTRHPQFLQLIEHLGANRRSYQIATNGRCFADLDFTRRVLACQPSIIRTSLYGARPRTHDSLTRAKGSFEQTVKGLHNLTALNAANVMVNYLIFKSNVGELLDAAAIGYEAGVRSFKFSLPIMTDGFRNKLPDPATVRGALRQATEWLAERDCEVRFEKMPLCVVPPRRLTEFCIEPDGEEGGLSSLFDKTSEPCVACDMADYCYGMEAGILSVYGAACAVPIMYGDIDESIVETMGIGEFLSSFAPRHNFNIVRIAEDDALADPDRVAAIIGRLTSFRRDGRFVALVP